MPSLAPQTTTDPLHAFLAGGRIGGSERPLPLVATEFDVSLAGGLAVVATRRRFRNAEPQSIEATITFPLPVQAVLFGLEARIDGRLLKAQAQRKAQARESYEAAIERGKSAVLHEEVLRGVHMLSVAHLPPGAEIEVTVHWAMALAQVGGRGHLRIPLTVGEIYGRSGLPESDELTHGGPRQMAELTVRCADGAVALLGGRLQEGRAQVPLDAPIDLEVAGWTPRDLTGEAADGRGVVLRLEPAAAGEGALDLAVLVDHSGSMSEICSGENWSLTKHQAVAAGLQSLATRLRRRDKADLWEFDDQLGHVGATHGMDPGAGLGALAARLSPPSGGTEIGAALAAVAGRSQAHDILLVTDGKSHALDVQALARTGRRFSVVLVGEDSLEANVGHLAALTGGEVFVAAGADLVEAMGTALQLLRTPHQAPSPLTGSPQQLAARRAGLTLSARWLEGGGPASDPVQGRAVAALAASLALPALEAEAATALAEAEGLVTHLTSLVLVDEAGAVQQGIPATRKVALPSPRTLVAATSRQMARPAMAASFEDPLSVAELLPQAIFAPRPAASAGAPSAPTPGSPPPSSGLRDLQAHGADSYGLLQVAAAIDWNAAPQRLRSGDLSLLEPGQAGRIRRAARRPEVVALAEQLGLDPLLLVLALLARTQAGGNRAAERLAKSILQSTGLEQLDRLAEMLELAMDAA